MGSPTEKARRVPAASAASGVVVGLGSTQAVCSWLPSAMRRMVCDPDPMAGSDNDSAPFGNGAVRFRPDLSGPGELNELFRSLPGLGPVMEKIRSLAGVDVPILIEGEPGTGVEFVAQELHGLSPRCRRPFVVVPWPAPAESTLAMQLFGGEIMASPHVMERQPGVFEHAAGGTVFVEEIRDIPYSLQIQLARLLTTRQIFRPGQAKPHRVDVRFTCATRFNLVQEAAEGRFYTDLLYKIRVAQIQLPALRDRLVDIPPLSAFYLRQCRLLPDKPLPVLSDEAMSLLLGYSWPGNMTELQSVIESAALRCAGAVVTPADLPQEIQAPGLGGGAFSPGSGQTEKDRFQAAMGAARGNRTLAARLLGISRATLYRRLKELGLAVRGEDVEGVSGDAPPRQS